jgi:transcriptional regulator with XRE-family HTH domain
VLQPTWGVTLNGSLIQRLRLQKGLSQHQLALRAGLHTGHLASIEQNRVKDPQVSTAVAIARVLGVPVEQLLEDEPAEAEATTP